MFNKQNSIECDSPSGHRQFLGFRQSAAAIVLGIFILQNMLFVLPTAAQTFRRQPERLAAPEALDTPISLTSIGAPATENFDSLASTGTSSTTPAGWGFIETLTNANNVYTAGTGSSNSGDTYSLGAAGSSERAFGGLRSSNLASTIGAAYTNDTGNTIASLAIAYTGEEWRLGTTGRNDQIDFQYSTDATSLTTGTWTDIDALDFVTPSNTGTAGLRDGNAAGNRTAISSTISGLNIPSGATFYIRWNDFDASGADDVLAIDDFSLTPGSTTGSINPAGTGTASPSTVLIGGTSLLTVKVTPGANPPSSGLSVTANLTAIGGAAAQQFFDNGTNGDATAGDNTFSYLATVSGTTTIGLKTLPVTITDAQSRSGSANISLTVTTDSTSPTGAGSASPNSLAPGANTLLTAVITPGNNPASTGITVTGNLTAIGGAAAQQFFDDGTNGDATAGDNTYSYLATVSASTAAGTKTLTINVSDAQGRASNFNIGLTVTGGGGSGDSPHTPDEHLLMGNPSGATTDPANFTNYLLPKSQYVMSYHRDRAIPNWVSWHLDSTWIGSASRQDDFRPDPTLPSGWYQVQSTSYSGSGYDRGHHTPSADRTDTVADNSATFLMTNMMPQAPGNNQGPWEQLETYARTLVSQGNEIYIVAGGYGSGGTGDNGFNTTINNGHVTVPAYTWKVLLVLPAGVSDLSRVTASTRAFAVIMPNNTAIRSDAWQKYLATVDQVEALTGYDFYSNVSADIQNQIESRLDTISNTSPQTVAGGTYANLDVSDRPQITLNGNVTITGNLNLGASIMNTGNFKITLAPGATVTRISGYISGQVEKQFSSTASGFVYPVGTANGFSPVTVDITAVGTVPSSLTVKAVQGTQPNVPSTASALRRYWTLTENGNLTANLTFQYLQADVPNTDTESALKLYRYEGAFLQIPATIDTGANTARATAITDFSDWTLIEQLTGPAQQFNIGGRVATAAGKPVDNALVKITNAGQTRITRTNQFGYYSFTDVPAGSGYVVDVTHKKYHFTSQTVNINNNNGEINFTSLD